MAGEEMIGVLQERPGRAGGFCILLMAAIAPAAAQQPPSYAEASAEVARRANDPGVQEWIEGVGKPFWNQHLQSVFSPCLQDLPENTSLSVRLLVEVGEGGKPLRYIDDAPTALSTCVKQQLQTIEWPKPPIELRYFPIELNVSTRKTRPSEVLDEEPAEPVATGPGGDRRVAYRCENGEELGMVFLSGSDRAELELRGKTLALSRKPTPSGFVYAGDSITVTGDDQELLVEDTGSIAFKCRRF
jgi:hypothetical protein